MPISIPTFATTQLTLLANELATEVTATSSHIASHAPATLQRAGLALTNLVLASQRTTLGGKLLIDLSPDPATTPSAQLPTHGLRVGDIVLVAPQPAGSARKHEIRDLEAQGARGVVQRVWREKVAVVLDGKDGVTDGWGRVWAVKVADDVTFRRMKGAMERLRDMGEDDDALVRVLFGLDAPWGDEIEEVEWLDESLNEGQREAVRFALAAREVALIHGPPGTGKTHTLIEVIRQLVLRGQRVLVAGPSNVAVDNIVERLSTCKIALTRLGHPARLLPSILPYSLDVLTQTSSSGEIVKDVRAEIDAKLAGVKRARGGRERRVLWGEVRDLRREYRERERRCVGGGGRACGWEGV